MLQIKKEFSLLTIAFIFRNILALMENKVLSKQELESMSTSDLINLADEYEIEIPDNLNRRFIIEELLETSEELFNSFNSDEKDDVTIDESENEFPDELPLSYNDTEINLTMRNPEWIFVFWDISESDFTELKFNENFKNLFLHIAFYESLDDDEKPLDSIEIKIELETREQYILIPKNKKVLNVTLVASFENEEPRILASTRRIQIPSVNEDIKNMKPGMKLNFPPLVNLSGLKTILHDYYLNHAQ